MQPRRKQMGLTVPKLKPTDELDWNVIKKELIEYFSSNTETCAARDALAILVGAGCDEGAILQNLYLFCGGHAGAMQALRNDLDFGRRKKRLLAIAELLQKTSSEIGIADELLVDIGVYCYFSPDKSNLETYAVLLRRVAGGVYRRLASKRITGRDQHLVYLSRMILSITGRPHYRELTDLVNATRMLHNPESKKMDTVESIRKRISHYPLA
jgi:hypothetical protein